MNAVFQACRVRSSSATVCMFRFHCLVTFVDHVSGLLFAEGGGRAGMEVVNWQFLKVRCVRGE